MKMRIEKRIDSATGERSTRIKFEFLDKFYSNSFLISFQRGIEPPIKDFVCHLHVPVFFWVWNRKFSFQIRLMAKWLFSVYINNCELVLA